jgi:central kinetochore subunit Mis15/CHL4
LRNDGKTPLTIYPTIAMPPLSVPTTAALPPSQRVPSTSPAVFRILNKLSRPSLLSLILDWLDDRNQLLSAPFLLDQDDEEDLQDLYPPATSLEELREYYNDLQARRGGKREIIDRIIEGDWRNGVSLYQLAMADMQYLYDHPTSQKWTALKVVQLRNSEDGNDDPEKGIELPCLPRFHPPTFLQNLQREVLPDVKAHYNLDRPQNLPLLLLRIYMLDSPYNTSTALSDPDPRTFDSSKTIYVAFPDASPHIFVSLTNSASNPAAPNVGTATDTRSLRKLLLDGIPKAFSRPRARYALQSTGLAAKTLESLLAHRGQGRTNAAGGGWGLYASDKKNDTPLNNQLPTPPADITDEELASKSDQLMISSRGMRKRRREDEEKTLIKRRKTVARARFGESALPNDGKAIERFDVRIEDPFPSQGQRPRGGDEDWVPDITVTFYGTHVFAGVRELVERGIIDGERMPGWMTGEEGISVGVVKDGRIQGFKGSGI